MSASLPLRFCRVTVSQPGTVTVLNTTSNANIQKVFTYQNSRGPRIDFTITRMSGPSGGGLNTAQIEIYNLNDNSKKFLLQKGNKVIIEAGYEYDYNVIFGGEVKSVTDKKQNADIITTLYSFTNVALYEKAFINESFTQISLNEFLDKMSSDHGFTLKRDNFTATIINRTYWGALKDILTTLGNQYNFTWMDHNGVIEVRKNENQTIVKYTFDPSSGLIGIPVITEKGADLVVFLQPNINVGDLFQLDSQFATFNLGGLEFQERILGNELQNALVRNESTDRFSGQFQVMIATHEGSTHENMWHTKIEGILPDIGT